MKVKTCKCEAMSVTFIDKTTIHLKGAWVYGSPHTHAVCFECGGRIRIAYSIVYVDSEGKPFHPKSAKRKKSGNKKRNKSRKGHSGNSAGETWRFVD